MKTGLMSLMKSLPKQLPRLEAAFRAQYSDAQCGHAGEQAATLEVLAQARDWLGDAHTAIRRAKTPTLYSLQRLAYATSLAVQLEAEAGAARNNPAPKDLALKAARAARKRAVTRAQLMAGGNEARVKELAAADGSGRDAQSVLVALPKLATLLKHWRRNAPLDALADDVGVNDAFISSLEAAATALREASPYGRQSPAALQGRLLTELAVLRVSLSAMKEEGVAVPVLRVRPKLKGAL